MKIKKPVSVKYTVEFQLESEAIAFAAPDKLPRSGRTVQIPATFALDKDGDLVIASAGYDLNVSNG
jgi:hypothetical protein